MFRVTTFALCSVLLASACGGASQAPVAPTAAVTPSPAALAINPCQLLTAADVQPLMKAPAVGQLGSSSTSATCSYNYGRVGGVGLTVWKGEFGNYIYSSTLTTLGTDGTTPLSGVGDRAYHAKVLAEIWFQKGDLTFSIKALALDVDNDLPLLRSLALKALSRL